MKQRSTLQTSKIFVMILRNFASATLLLIQVYTKFQEDIHLPLSLSVDNLLNTLRVQLNKALAELFGVVKHILFCHYAS